MIRNNIYKISIALLLILLLGGANAWGQTGYSGVYYFVNCGSGKTDPNDPKIAGITDETQYFYLVPADNPKQDYNRDAWYSSSDTNGDSEKPYLTTYRTNKDAAEVPEGVTNRLHNSVWIVKFASTDSGKDYYHIIHAATGKYVVYEPPFSTKNNRKSVHLLTTDSPGENAKFAITVHSDNYNFRPKSIGTGGSTNKYLNASNRNFNYYYSHSKVKDGDVVDYYEGLIGLWKDAGDASDWKPVVALLDAPTISDPDVNNIVTVTDANSLSNGYNIRYTTDGTDPTASSPILEGGSYTLTSSVTLKAIVECYGLVLTAVASKALDPVPCATPVITYDNTTSMVSITCATTGSTIYYTTNGTDPTASSTEYSVPFSVTSPTTVKAMATRTNFPNSAVAELSISQVVTPTIQDNGSNAISITTTTPGATIYYTTDGSTPSTSSIQYNGPLTDNVSNVTIKAIAVKEGMITSTVGSGLVKLQCATPVISRVGMTFTLSCSKPTDADLYYTLDVGSETLYSGPVPFTADQLPLTVTAVARHSDYTASGTASLELINGSGTPEDPYLIYGDTDFANFVTNVNNGTTASASYKLGSDVSASGMTAITTEFTGTFDGNGYTISGLEHALFNSVNGGTVKNVILDNVNIGENENGNAGAICCEATGDTRIYNCGVLASNSTVEKDEDGYDKITSCDSSISGSNYVGSIAGLLDGSSRVINCFSYANVSGGSEVGGIVGHNHVATTADNLKTMVMNCLFYGEVSGTSIAPIYNGEIITNDGDANGVNNFNYFRLEASYIQNTAITKVYNCALGAETRFLQRFEFFRYLLNSNRELAAWWATGDAANKDEMKKWVMEPSQIGTSTPYPILKSSGKYASVVNYTPSETAYDDANRNKGRKLGTLAVTIQKGSGAVFTAPSGASITKSSISLTITDKDFDHFNFNYGKVQLPYYNDVGTENYTDGKVVTGWKIVSITGGTTGSYSTGDDVTYTDGVLTATPYNFADRKCTDKDKYSVSGRVFNQGAYWDVPEGVTAITIEPYWGKAVYLSDAYWDVVYKNGTGGGTAAGTAFDAMTTAANVPNVGGGVRYKNGVSTFNGQLVYTSMSNAIASSGSALFSGDDASGHTVYDYAVVLVGNYHHTAAIAAVNTKPYTVTSVDLDGDNEPDYSLMLRFNARLGFHPVRYDFLNLIGLGMAQKSTGGSGSYNLGIIQPKFWFEVTNTALFRVTQFEYSPEGREKKPIILQGGVIEQWVTLQKDPGDRVSYFHVGGNVWFKEFHRGSHQDNAKLKTPHPPVSVTGGDYNKFYLTGLYQSQAGIYDDNAECYISGGRFGEVAGAGMEGIGTSDGKGNITWVIDHADMKEFYGGGINFAKPVHGNIHTIISNSHVDQFCGGPKFGDMESGRTVITTATGCTFGTYFGAGFGGNSYNRFAPPNRNNVINLPGPGKVNNVQQNLNSWNDWVGSQYTQSYSSTYGGVSTQIDYQFIPMSSNIENVARLWVEYVNFSLATCHSVTSTLTGCTITGNFYGGGNLGEVDGPVASILTSCKVDGSVFGAGYSATLPNVEVMNTGGFQTEPYFYEDLGTYRTAVFPATTTYTWQQGSSVSIDTSNHILYTNADLSNLGSVSGNVSLNLKGTTVVTGNVYGGGDESGVNGDSRVTIDDDATVSGSVFGGGNVATVGGSVEVTVNSGLITMDVYGGGALANTNVSNTEATPPSPLKTTTVNLHGGIINQNVYGGGLGRMAVGMPGDDSYVAPIEAKVYGDVLVTLNGTQEEGEGGVITYPDNCVVKGSIFGCNNLNGSPQKAVTVHVYKTVGYAGHTGTDPEKLDSEDKADHSYHLAAVYGGGNLAAFCPDVKAVTDTVKTHVIIDGCGLTSIRQVYGGGNAASTPATSVTVNGTFEIEELFGGGNGKDDIVINNVTKPNPGANVGFRDYSAVEDTYNTKEKRTTDPETAPTFISTYVYGSGKASVNIYGGKIHRVFGGSNTKGNVRQTAVTMLEETGGCDFCVDEAYGGGKSAPMDAEAKLLMACIPGLQAAYGGAEAADIQGNVTLNITNGTFDRVFGGNNISGTIRGSITVNVEEVGCKPIKIGELYGGGNQAGYSVYGYDDDGKPVESGTTPLYDDPQVNVMSFTSIGNIYGGGFGANATMVANPTVNVNEAYGRYYDSDVSVVGENAKTPGNYPIPSHAKGRMGTVNNVFGGGNAAKVIGNTNVNIATLDEVYVVKEVTANTTLPDGCYTRSGTGTTASPFVYTGASGTASADITYYEKKKVEGVDVRGNVFGGGNQAEVTGNSKVKIGKKNEGE